MAKSSFTLYGPGNLLMEAGRNLGPFNTNNGSGGGILAIGNGANLGTTNSVKPYLPLAGADITLRYGVAGGTDYASRHRQVRRCSDGSRQRHRLRGGDHPQARAAPRAVDRRAGQGRRHRQPDVST